MSILSGVVIDGLLLARGGIPWLFFVTSFCMYEVIEFRERYKDINTVLYWLVEQAKVGVQYCQDNFPAFDNPVDLYNYFKARTRFQDDPPGVELIQNAYTLFEDNYHGISGRGDCDCFSTLLLSALWANGMKQNFIMLAGNSKRSPSHIYIMTVFKGEELILDLTEPKINMERSYKYYQDIPVF